MLLFELVHVRLQLLQVLKLSILSEGMVPTDHLDPLEVCQQRPKSIHMQGLLCLHEVAYFLHASAPCGHRSGVPGMCARAWTPKDLDSPSAHLRVKTGNSASRTGTQGPHMACCSVVKDESVTGDQHGTHVSCSGHNQPVCRVAVHCARQARCRDRDLRLHGNQPHTRQGQRCMNPLTDISIQRQSALGHQHAELPNGNGGDMDSRLTDRCSLNGRSCSRA